MSVSLFVSLSVYYVSVCFMSAFLFACLPSICVYLSVSLPVCLSFSSVCLTVRLLSAYLSVCLCLFFFLPVCLMSVSVCMFACLSVCLSVFLRVYLYVYLSVYLCVGLLFCLPVNISLNFCNLLSRVSHMCAYCVHFYPSFQKILFFFIKYEAKMLLITERAC
jgi:hypothetical protein